MCSKGSLSLRFSIKIVIYFSALSSIPCLFNCLFDVLDIIVMNIQNTALFYIIFPFRNSGPLLFTKQWLYIISTIETKFLSNSETIKLEFRSFKLYFPS